MKETMRIEKNNRIELLKSLGIKSELCDRMFSEEDFVLVGQVMEPKPDYIECKRKKTEFEAKTGGTVLFGLLDILYGVQCLSFIYVSQYEDDWKYDKEELKRGSALVEVYNLSEDFSEMGSITFEVDEAGHPYRTA